MVSMKDVRANNGKLKDLGAGLVGVFVGGTSGIGETTAREFVRATDKPKVYLVGRDKEQAVSIINEFRQLNPESTLCFIQSDVSLLRNVDEVSEEIKRSEDEVNLLFMSPGILSTKGRDETSEGLDKKFSLHYYCRMRFIANLLPLLTAASESGRLSRTMSILGAGTEGYCVPDDLSLKHNYTVTRCSNHACTMNSFAVEKLAETHPNITFIHTSPGMVETNIIRDQGTAAKVGLKALFTVLKPLAVPIEECGERHLYVATSPTFPAKNSDNKVEASVGSAGITGSGGYLVNWKCNRTGRVNVMNYYRQKQSADVMWSHTLDVFSKICSSEDGKY